MSVPKNTNPLAFRAALSYYGGVPMTEWFEVAGQKAIVQRSLRIALIVGSLLTLINHYDVLFGEPLTTTRLVKILLTYCVPYCVSTFASVSTQLENRKNQ